MSLHGTLETFALPDVMALLAATKKTGELRVVGGKLDGRVHLDAGRVIGASVGRADSFVDAVFELLRLTAGKFSFDADKAPDEPAEPVDIEPLLLEAQARLTEWRGIEAVVPSMDHGVSLVKDLSDPHVTLASEQWKMVVAVASSRCVHDVADRLGLGEYAVCKSLKDLVESGVAEIGEPPAPAPAAKPEPPKAAEPKPEPKPEPKAAEPEPEPVRAPEPKAEAPKPEPKPEPEPEPAKPEVKIEAELKPAPLPEKPVEIPALKATDENSPIPPGHEPVKAKKADKPEKPAVDPAQAKQLVSQLAAMGTERPKTDKVDKAEPADKPEAKAETADKADKTDDEDKPESTAPAAEGADGEEPLNRGLLLKFLSSVRQ